MSIHLKEVHTVPVWEEEDGSLTYGMEPREDHPPVIGWANIGLVDISGSDHQIVLAWEEE